MPTPPPAYQTEGLSGYIISRLTQGFSIRCLRFTSDVAASHARLASGWRAAPLPKRTGKAIDATIADQDYGALAAELLSDAACSGKQIVVCWHHGNIPSLLHALGAKDGDYPDPWNRNVFNLILKVEFLGNKT